MLFLNGCTARELNDREFVQAMELDYRDGKLAGGFGEFMVEGETIGEVQKYYQDRINHYLDLGHVKVLILGEDLLKKTDMMNRILGELKEKPILAGNILVFSYGYEDDESCLYRMEEKGIVPGEYLSNLYKNNPNKKHRVTATLGELMSENLDQFTLMSSY